MAAVVDSETAAPVDETQLLYRVPPELVVDILKLLPQDDLARCLRVNSVFCSLGLPLLYTHVKLGEFGPWPSFDNPYGGPSSPCSVSRGTLVNHVQRVDISPHKTSVCEHSALQWTALPRFPRLSVVRLYLLATWSGNRVFHTNVDPHDVNRKPERKCAALINLRAPTLVVRGVTLAHNVVPRHELPQHFEESVRHYVAVFQPDHPYFLARNAERTAQRQGVLFRSRIPPLVTRVTVVFYPPGKSYAWRAGPGNHTLSWELIWSHATSLFTNLATWMTQRQPHALTIVNVGALQRIDDDTSNNDTVDGMHETVTKLFRTAAEAMFEDEEQRNKMLDHTRVITMEEWLAGDEWREVFDEHEVLPWLSDASQRTHRRRQDDTFFGFTHMPQIPPGPPTRHLPLFQLTVSDA